MSANGQYQIAICNNGGSPDSMMVSRNWGTTFSIMDAQVGGTKLWTNCCMTDCGRVMICYENGGSGGAYYSLDYGHTWTPSAPAVFINGTSKPTFCINGKYLIGQKSGFTPQYLQFTEIF